MLFSIFYNVKAYKSMIKIILILNSIIFSQLSFSGYLIQNTKIVKVGSTNWNEKVFFIQTKGGTGDCFGKTIVFPESYAQSLTAYNQMHSMVVTAFVAGEVISVYNYSDRKYKNGDKCTGANRISLIRE